MDSEKFGIVCLLAAGGFATEAANGYDLGGWQFALFGAAFASMAGAVYFFSR